MALDMQLKVLVSERGVAKSEAQSSLAGQDHQLSSKMEMQIKDWEASLCRLERLSDSDGGTVFTPCPTPPHPPGLTGQLRNLPEIRKATVALTFW